jgi:type II secretory pathway component PulF
MAYKYAVYTDDRRILRGRLDVATEYAAEATLRRAGYARVLSLEPVAPPLRLADVLPSLFGVKRADVVDFAGQLATLIGAGIALPAALRLLAGQRQAASLRDAVGGLLAAIEAGQALSEGLEHYPAVFPASFRQAVRAAEKSGTLEEGLRRAATYLEKDLATVGRLRRVMTYPLIVLVVAAAVAALLLTIALPPLVRLFDSLGADLPWTTRLLLGGAGFLSDHGPALGVAVLAVVLGVTGLLRLGSVRYGRDNFLLKLPVFGTLLLERHLYQAFRTAAVLTASGVRLPSVLETVAGAEPNRVLREALERVRDRLLQGEGLAAPLADDPLFPPLVAEMLAVAEETGTMDAAFTTLADLYERRADRRTATLLALVEPALTLIIGAVVVFIALALVVPLYSVLRSMQ